MNRLPRLLSFFAFLGLAAVASLHAADLSSATVAVPAAKAPQLTQVAPVAAQPISKPAALPDWMNPQLQSQNKTGSCSARTKCYASPFPWVSCSGEFDCYTSNGCYVYCDGYEYDCPPFYLCP
jgi:hypothetical protein